MAKDNLERSIYLSIKEILTSAREKAYKAVNFAMVEAYWNVGKLIVEAQDGNERAEYGEELLKNLSKELTKELGKGFSFVARQKRITAEGDHFYIDLVFYNYI